MKRKGRGAHLKTEFGFDVAQVAKKRYASEKYHDFIGFKVSKPLLERTFPLVYGLELKDVLANGDLAILRRQKSLPAKRGFGENYFEFDRNRQDQSTKRRRRQK